MGAGIHWGSWNVAPASDKGGTVVHDSHLCVLLANRKSQEEGAISPGKEGKTVSPWFNLSEKVVKIRKHPLMEC